MKYLQLFLLLFVLLDSPFIQAVTTISPVTLKSSQSDSSVLTTKFGETGRVGAIDSKGQWISIGHKKYILNGTGVIKLKDLKLGMQIYFNVEKGSTEKVGRVTRIWVK